MNESLLLLSYAHYRQSSARLGPKVRVMDKRFSSLLPFERYMSAGTCFNKYISTINIDDTISTNIFGKRGKANFRFRIEGEASSDGMKFHHSIAAFYHSDQIIDCKTIDDTHWDGNTKSFEQMIGPPAFSVNKTVLPVRYDIRGQYPFKIEVNDRILHYTCSLGSCYSLLGAVAPTLDLLPIAYINDRVQDGLRNYCKNSLFINVFCFLLTNTLRKLCSHILLIREEEQILGINLDQRTEEDSPLLYIYLRIIRILLDLVYFEKLQVVKNLERKYLTGTTAKRHKLRATVSNLEFWPQLIAKTTDEMREKRFTVADLLKALSPLNRGYFEKIELQRLKDFMKRADDKHICFNNLPSNYLLLKLQVLVNSTGKAMPAPSTVQPQADSSMWRPEYSYFSILQTLTFNYLEHDTYFRYSYKRKFFRSMKGRLYFSDSSRIQASNGQLVYVCPKQTLTALSQNNETIGNIERFYSNKKLFTTHTQINNPQHPLHLKGYHIVCYAIRGNPPSLSKRFTLELESDSGVCYFFHKDLILTIVTKKGAFVANLFRYQPDKSYKLVFEKDFENQIVNTLYDGRRIYRFTNFSNNRIGVVFDKRGMFTGISFNVPQKERVLIYCTYDGNMYYKVVSTERVKDYQFFSKRSKLYYMQFSLKPFIYSLYTVAANNQIVMLVDFDKDKTSMKRMDMLTKGLSASDFGLKWCEKEKLFMLLTIRSGGESNNYTTMVRCFHIKV